MKTIKILAVCFTLAIAASCTEWLDVMPKTQVETKEMFKTEDGFKDVLMGVYIQMASPQLYGRNLTYGIVDCMGYAYSSAGTATYKAFRDGNYTTNKTARAMIDSTWSASYAALANLNIMIEAFEKVDKTIFQEANYNCIYGESLGLRAYLLFDMLRLYAPSHTVGADKDGIPYVTRYTYDVTPSSTVAQCAQSVIKDLTDAAALLKKSDPVYTGLTNPTTFLTNSSRPYHLNYYAVTATLARAYLWIGDKVNAAKCAHEVIDSGKFPWTKVDNMATTEAARYRTFGPEQIFTMQVSQIAEQSLYLLKYGKYVGNELVNATNWRNAVYPYADDWRKLYFWSEDKPTTYSGEKFNTKLWQFDDMPVDYKTRLPLIRLPEMYLIVAECEPANAVAAFNTIRANRGISTAFPPAATQTQIDTEIRWEYVREFICEGVMFYYYKRLDAAQMPTTTSAGMTTINKARYILPMPDAEVEFGHRQ